MVDSRKHPRFETQMPAEADVFGKAVPVTIIEISIEGLRLRTKEYMPPDTLLAVTITKGRNITFSGWVIWALDKFMPDGQIYETGIQINAITDAASELNTLSDRHELIQEILRMK